ncbi:hypothetical protein [Nocardia sp. NRRL S-836]|uniref:hypothetical protein n=1 Tax=Nocardia sp. NRRL S-836 TaxID=1519492 RepID=UPI0006AD9868|nr:hypothetical protein [Nocardia sp. NRRL S-836]
MKRTTSVVAVSALAALVLTGQSASAQEDVTPAFRISPDILVVDQHFEVRIEQGTCPGGTEHVTSPGFAAPLPAGELHGTAVSVPGKYTATLKCKGSSKTGTAQFGVFELGDTFFFLPDEVEAGGDISVIKTKQSFCGEVATSPGFTAPIELKYETPNTRSGNGKVVDRAGTYEAEMICGGRPIRHQFVVKAKAPAPTSTPAAPTSTTQKPKGPVVKPKGAPQTGGGGTA